jgi:hypothetical protein
MLAPKTAIAQHPHHAASLRNYAKFCETVLCDLEIAQLGYLKALQLNPFCDGALNDFAEFLETHRGEEGRDIAKRLFQKAIDIEKLRRIPVGARHPKPRNGTLRGLQRIRDAERESADKRAKLRKSDLQLQQKDFVTEAAGVAAQVQKLTSNCFLCFFDLCFCSLNVYFLSACSLLFSFYYPTATSCPSQTYPTVSHIT